MDYILLLDRCHALNDPTKNNSSFLLRETATPRPHKGKKVAAITQLECQVEVTPGAC